MKCRKKQKRENELDLLMECCDSFYNHKNLSSPLSSSFYFDSLVDATKKCKI